MGSQDHDKGTRLTASSTSPGSGVEHLSLLEVELEVGMPEHLIYCGSGNPAKNAQLCVLQSSRSHYF